jgi:hypothetical protein
MLRMCWALGRRLQAGAAMVVVDMSQGPPVPVDEHVFVQLPAENKHSGRIMAESDRSGVVAWPAVGRGSRHGREFGPTRLPGSSWGVGILG